MQLGKKPARFDTRTLRLENYVDGGEVVPRVPDEARWHDKVPAYQLYSNDRIGCCAIAAPAHAVATWTANDGDRLEPSEEAVLADYQRIGGWTPGDPSTDRGCYLLDVMAAWRRTGVVGRRIGAFAAVSPHDHELTCAAVWLFGGLTVGLALPLAAQDMQDWEAPGRLHRRRPRWEHGSWGGHAVQIVAYDPTWLYCVTWGQVKRISYGFFAHYCDEAYAALGNDWLGPDFTAPNGLDMAKLMRDLSKIGS